MLTLMQSEKKIINTPDAPAPIGPYNQAILANDTLYVSGQIPLDPKSAEIKADTIQEATHQVMANLGAILEEAGMSWSNVVKCSIFLANMSDFPQVNEIYGSYFENTTPPARETVEVATLPKHVPIEISCIAVH